MMCFAPLPEDWISSYALLAYHQNQVYIVHISCETDKDADSYIQKQFQGDRDRLVGQNETR